MAITYAIINKETLNKIISCRKVSNDYIIKKAHVKSEKLGNWLDVSNSALPTIKQAKDISKILRVPFAGLYMNAEDIEDTKIPKFKNYRKIEDPSIEDDSALNLAIIDLLTEREFLINSYKELKIAVDNFTPIIPDGDDPVVWAQSIRNEFGLSLSEQYNSKSTRKFFIYLRNAIESKGVFIQCFEQVPVEQTRGLAIFENKLPIIGVNNDDHYPAKSFSVIHELVHLYKRTSSICNLMNNSANIAQEEIFCNAVAGELLVPAVEMTKVLNSLGHSKPKDLTDVERIADKFSVSKDVIVRRLIDLGVINQKEFDAFRIKIAEELEQKKELNKIAKENGQQRFRPQAIKDRVIDRTSSNICNALFEGYLENVFSKKDIAQHLEINPKHIDGFILEVSKWNK